LESVTEGGDMRRKLTWVFLIGAAAAGITAYAGNVFATPASGFVGTTIAVGRFDDIDVFNQSFPAWYPRPWISIQKTKGPSDLYIQSNVWAVGGSTGWHTHPGHSLIIVTAGAVTDYEGDDPLCTPHVYTAGMTFVDPGGDHVHLVRNEGAIQATGFAVQLIPAAAARRIDALGNPSCGF
jgi:quercetin dioxygenase-like cupin family protein